MKALAVRCVLYYLRFWARAALLVHRPIVIGIAGSVGKSSTKKVLSAALASFGKTIATEGNSETGLPLSILGIQVEGFRMIDWIRYIIRAPFGVFNLTGVTYLIAEMGIDDPFPPKNMQYLLTIVEPDIAVFVQESAAHTEQFEKALTDAEQTSLDPEARLKRLIELITLEDVRMARTDRCTTIITNADNAFLSVAFKEMRSELHDKKVCTFGTSKECDAYYLRHTVSLDETRFDCMMEGVPVMIRYRGMVLPEEYREVTAAALLVCASLGLNLNQAISSIERTVQFPKSRASVLKGIRGSVILDSSYNASRESVVAFVQLVAELKQQTSRTVVCCIGDMRELGNEAELEHATVASRIKEVADYVYCVGALTKKYIIPRLEGSLRNVRWFETSAKLGEHLKNELPDNALVLVKGSQNTIFLEEAIKPLLADPADQALLCRQEEYWRAAKRASGYLFEG